MRTLLRLLPALAILAAAVAYAAPGDPGSFSYGPVNPQYEPRMDPSCATTSADLDPIVGTTVTTIEPLAGQKDLTIFPDPACTSSFRIAWDPIIPSTVAPYRGIGIAAGSSAPLSVGRGANLGAVRIAGTGWCTFHVQRCK